MNVSGWMIHIVGRRRRSGINADGTPSYGPLEHIRARVEKVRRFVRNQSGKEVLIQSEIVTLAESRYDDVFWFPSIAGEQADNERSFDAGRSPTTVFVATNKSGSQSLVTIGFS